MQYRRSSHRRGAVLVLVQMVEGGGKVVGTVADAAGVGATALRHTELLETRSKPAMSSADWPAGAGSRLIRLFLDCASGGRACSTK